MILNWLPDLNLTTPMEEEDIRKKVRMLDHGLWVFVPDHRPSPIWILLTILICLSSGN